MNDESASDRLKDLIYSNYGELTDEVAADIGISRQTLSWYCNGGLDNVLSKKLNKKSLGTIRLLACALGVNDRYILQGLNGELLNSSNIISNQERQKEFNLFVSVLDNFGLTFTSSFLCYKGSYNDLKTDADIISNFFCSRWNNTDFSNSRNVSKNGWLIVLKKIVDSQFSNLENDVRELNRQLIKGSVGVYVSLSHGNGQCSWVSWENFSNCQQIIFQTLHSLTDGLLSSGGFAER